VAIGLFLRAMPSPLVNKFKGDGVSLLALFNWKAIAHLKNRIVVVSSFYFFINDFADSE
jgi:hypothetical protein